MTKEERSELRRRYAHPVITALEKWCLADYPKVLPKSPIGKALGYIIEYARELSRYIIDGTSPSVFVMKLELPRWSGW